MKRYALFQKFLSVNITFMENLTYLIKSSPYVLAWLKELLNNCQTVPGTIKKAERP